MNTWDQMRAEAKHVAEMHEDREYIGGQVLADIILSIPLHCRPTEFTYTTLPDDDVNSSVWRVQAEWRGPGDRWAITRIGYCLSVRGRWEHEPSPSNRSEHFKLTHRFTLAEAIGRLPAALDSVVINSLRVRDGVLVNAEEATR